MFSVSSPQPQDKPPESSNSQWASWLLIGIALAAVIALAIVNTTSKESQSASSATESGTHTIDVKVDGMAFVPNHVDVEPGTHLVVNFTNTGDQVHDLKIGDAETGRVDPGDTVQLDAGVIESSIEGYCTIAGHRLQGMTFNVNVGESAPRTGGHDHHHAVAGASNPHVKVPSAAELGAFREGFNAYDASLAPAANTTVHAETWSMTEEIVEASPAHRASIHSSPAMTETDAVVSRGRRPSTVASTGWIIRTEANTTSSWAMPAARAHPTAPQTIVSASPRQWTMRPRVHRMRAVGEIAVPDRVGSSVTMVPTMVNHANPQTIPRE